MLGCVSEVIINVLVVEDNEQLREMLSYFLERVGYNVWSASNGKEALEFLCSRENSIQVLITDCNMPIMDGIQLIREIFYNRFSLKIVVLSGNPRNKALISDLADHNCEISFLGKPFNPQDLLSTIGESPLT
jgi:CheY-like chemotaxis protein